MFERKDSTETTFSKQNITKESALQAFKSLREQSQKNFPNGLSLDEINKEIEKSK